MVTIGITGCLLDGIIPVGVSLYLCHGVKRSTKVQRNAGLPADLVADIHKTLRANS